jgi:trafficking protein particle complex subunit 3
VNAELVTLTYGTIVSQLCADYESDYVQVNQQLDKMGYNIGMRLIEDFLSKSNIPRCGNFRETADMISKVGFKMFLNITPVVTNWTADNKSFSLLFDENPLADFVELPDDGRAQDELWFSNILCGILRGALEMVCSAIARPHIVAHPNRSRWRSKPASSAIFYEAMIQQKSVSL